MGYPSFSFPKPSSRACSLAGNVGGGASGIDGHACMQSLRTSLCDLQGLPAWNLLLLTRRPFAVPLANLADVPAVLAGMKAKVWYKP